MISSKKGKKQKLPVATTQEKAEPVEIPSWVIFKDTEIIIDFNSEESSNHIHDDFEVLPREGIEKTKKKKRL